MNQSGYADLLNQSIIDSDTLIIGNLNLPNLDPNSVAYINGSNNLADIVLSNGQLLIGKTGNAPVAGTLTGTTDEINITNGPGSITLSTPQPIATTSSPTFNNVSVTSLNSVPIGNYIITPSTSDLNMNSHSISNVNNFSGPTYSRLADNIVSNSAGSTGSNIAVFSGTTGKIIQDTGMLSTNIVSNTAGSTGSNIAVFSGTTGKIIQDTGVLSTNLVSNQGGSTGLNVCVFDGISGKIIQDNGLLSTNLFGGPFLPLAGGTMSGPINMSTNNINSINNENFTRDINLFKPNAGTNIVLGRVGTTGGSAQTSILFNISGSTIAGSNQIVMGSSNNVGNFQYSIAIGDGINSGGFGAVSIGGGNNGIINPQNNSVAIGTDMVLGSGINGICIGKAAGTTGSINNAIAIGSGAVNNTASSILLGDSALSNVRPNNNLLCDLGTTGAYFKSGYLSGNLAGITFSRTVDSIVSCTASSVTSGNVVTWSGTSGRVIQDSGASLSQYLPLAGGTMSGPINMNNNIINNVGGSTFSGPINMNNNIINNVGGSTFSGSLDMGSNSINSISGATFNGLLDMGINTINRVKGMTFTSGTTLGGTACIVNIDNTFARGNYLRIGGSGRNIGVMASGPHFMSFNADYDSTASNFKYNSTGVAVTLLRMDGTNGRLQYAASGTAGNTVTASDGLTWDTSGNVSIATGNLSIDTAGKTIKIKQGSNACAGVGATLSSGAVTVNTTAVATGDIILLSCTGAGGTQGIPRISSISSGTSFTITSSSASDSSTYSWIITKAA